MSANIKIGANTSSFQKQMSDMTRQLKTLNSEFSLSATKAKLFGTAQEQLKVKQSQLTASIKVQNTMVELQQKVMSKLTGDLDKQKLKREELNRKITETTTKYKESVKETGKNSEESKKLKDELTKLKESYAQNEKAIDNTNKKLDNSTIKMNNVKKAVMENEKALDGVNNKIKNVKLDNTISKLNKTSEVTGRVANKLLPLATIIGVAGVAASKFSMDFEHGLHKVYTIADRSAVPVNNMRRAVLDLSNQMGISSVEIENNVYDAISAGQKTGDAVDFVRKSTKLATAGFAEAGQTMDVLTSIYNAYGQTAKDVTKDSDILIATQNIGKTTVGDLSQNIGLLIPVAKESGVQLNQVGAGLALMTKQGIQTSEAITNYKAMLSEMNKTGSKSDKVLKKLTGEGFEGLIKKGKTVGDVVNILNEYAAKNNMKLGDMFGNIRSVTGALALAGHGGKDFNDILHEMNNSSGATEKAFNEMSNTTEYNLKKALNQGKNALIGFGDVIAPFISIAAQGLSKISQAFDGLSQGQKKLTVGIGASVLGFTGLFFGISKITGATSEAIKNYKMIKGLMDKWRVATKLQTAAQAALNFVMGMNPITLWIIGIAALVGGFIYLWKTSAGFRNFWIGLWNGIKNIVSICVNSVIGFFKGLINFIKNDWKQILLFLVNPFAGAFALLYKHCTSFRNFINNLGKSIIDTLKQWGSSIGKFFTHTIPNALNNLGKSISNFFTKTIPNSIKFLWNNYLLGLPNKIVYGLAFLVGRIVSGVSNLGKYLAVEIPKIINSIVNWFATLPGRLYTWLTTSLNNFMNWGMQLQQKAYQYGYQVINNFINWVSQLPGRFMNWLTNSINNFMNWGMQLQQKAYQYGYQLINNFINWVSQLPSRFSNWLSQTLNNLVNWGINMINSGRNAAINLTNSIVDGVKSLPGRMMNIGKYIVQGLWQGIVNAKDWIMGKIRSLGDSIVSGFKAGLGIHSPARKMIPVGDFTIQGVDVGMTNAMPKLLQNVKDKMLNLTGKMKATINNDMPDIGTNFENKFSLNTSISKDDLNNINSKLNTKTNNKVIVLVENKTILDGEVIGTATYKRVAKKMQSDENSYKVTQGKRGYTIV